MDTRTRYFQREQELRTYTIIKVKKRKLKNYSYITDYYKKTITDISVFVVILIKIECIRSQLFKFHKMYFPLICNYEISTEP